MAHFMLNPAKKLTTDHLFKTIWDDEEDVDESIVWVYISYLRQKLQAIQADISILGEKGWRLCLRTRLEEEQPMFRRLRLQFITIASLAILFILVFTVGIINTVRSFQTEQEISKVLNILTENNGSFGKQKLRPIRGVKFIG